MTNARVADAVKVEHREGGDRLRRMMAALALAVSLLGCDARVMPWDQVALRTSDAYLPVACLLAGMEGELIVEPEFGTAWRTGPDDILPVIWPRGFTGRRVGSEVEVLNRDGNVVATTGRKYEIFYSKLESRLVFGCG